jgi:hypothetical protein
MLAIGKRQEAHGAADDDPAFRRYGRVCYLIVLAVGFIVIACIGIGSTRGGHWVLVSRAAVCPKLRTPALQSSWYFPWYFSERI